MATSTLSSVDRRVNDWVEPALRFLHYAALLGLFGWAAFPLIGLRGLDWLPRSERRGDALIMLAIAAPLLSIVLMLASIAAMMGQPITALDWETIEAMTFTTDIGRAFLGRTALLIAALFALLLSKYKAAALPFAALSYAAALMTLGWNGHAAATEGSLGLFHRLNNGVHLLAAALWIGAIGWFLGLAVRAHLTPQRAPVRALLSIMHGFAPLGVTLVTIVAITGIINAQLIFGVENSAAVLTMPYGMFLAVKLALVAAMIAFGGHNARIGRRNAIGDVAQPRDPRATLSALRRSLAAEFSLAICVTALVAVLGMMSPMPMR